MTRYLIQQTYTNGRFKGTSFLIGKDNKVHNLDFDCSPHILYTLEEAINACRNLTTKDTNDGYDCRTYEPYEVSEKRMQSEYVKYQMI